ncbi:hypothetical protein B0H14DRAFT_812051 [Mycena olivaceomarginata]|nr:hypothetical protein B0H14DRAFT_812051 [Mycena olivaceomarginata]
MYGITEPPLSGSSARGSRALSTPRQPTLGLAYPTSRTCTSTTASDIPPPRVQLLLCSPHAHAHARFDWTSDCTRSGTIWSGGTRSAASEQLCVVGADSTSRSLPTIEHNSTCGVPALRRVVHLQHAEKGPLVVHLGTSASPDRASAAVCAHTPSMLCVRRAAPPLMLIQTSCGAAQSGDGPERGAAYLQAGDELVMNRESAGRAGRARRKGRRARSATVDSD